MSTLTDSSAPKPTPVDSMQTVLVVDDDARLRDVLWTVLTPLKCEVVQAGSGEEALTVLLQRKVAVIVLDVNMPGMDGFETAQLIRDVEELASTPIIFLTGQADAGDLDRGYDLGAVDFLVKPVSRAVLYAKVKALLELDRSFARLHREAAELHEEQLQAARAAEIRHREELAPARARARLANLFAEQTVDLASLKKTIVTELGQLIRGDCLLRLPDSGDGWDDSFARPESLRKCERPHEWLAQKVTDRKPSPTDQLVLVEELTARGELVGTLCVGRPDGEPFTDTEVALFRAVAVVAALSISNATLFRVQAEYAAVMQGTGDAILAVDGAGEIRSCNKAAEALFSQDCDTLVGRSIVELAVDGHRDRLREQLNVALSTRRQSSLETTIAANGDRQVDVLITLSPIDDSVDLSVAAVVHDLTEIKQAQSVISHLASHDPLTDLPNRRQLTERLDELSRQQDGELAALLYMDFNKFKGINDTYGHETGDELLVEVADRLRSAVRADTLVCRVGGDEFIILFEHVESASAAVAGGNRILEQVQSRPVQCENATVQPSLSMGISVLGASAHTPQELLTQADIAMFEAKKNRLDECVLYTESMGSRRRGNAHLRAKLSDAIARSELRMVYQPIVNAVTGELFGLEALVRWRVPDDCDVPDDEVPASEIIALAEASGQAGSLGRWTVTRSFEDYVALGRNDLKLHVNLSPAQVLDKQFLSHLIGSHRDKGIAPELICLELTERAFTKDPSPAYADLHRARELGFSLALDDFGVDHASMTTLKHIPANWLKIDRSLVEDVHESDRAQRLVRGQIAVAACMEIDLIAEGVEKAEQAAWLTEAGCVLQQGFWHARPIEATDLADAVGSWRAAQANRVTGES
ncbi:EAL domain-containing protein [Mycobacterium barrassiae]|uniref:two-component system response regulator n=1 Tax=Mycobacterium barrassiae TaxID=319709 RepID=UPI002265B33A|nr:EAL domain-containing protein [Mycobacterium barrassiae]MCV7300785.1 EAL domain-containing protein [Mycobacterium barrassiae]